MFRRLVPIALCLFGLGQPAIAECAGRNLLEEMAATDRQALIARTHQVPYAQGNLWRAVKGDRQITLIGTYHMDDARHDRTMQRLAGAFDQAATVLVEAGPEEMAALKARFANEPGLMIVTDGPTLPEELPEEVWAKLSDAMAARGVPGFMAAKMQPWYLSMLLSIPPCALEAMGEDRGLDAQVIEEAGARGLPVQALEPYDTIFKVFDSLTREDQLSMITASLALEDQSADMSVTMADAYFAEESRLIWEFSKDQALTLDGYTPDRVAHEFGVMEAALMVRRNHAWIPVLTAAAERGPVLAAFGALHLSGEDGVLALLEQQGFTLERLTFK